MACADCTDNTGISTHRTSVAVLTPSFVRTAILDLLVLCSSRVKLGYGSGKHTVEPPVKRKDLTVKGLGTGGRESCGIEGFKVRIPSVDFSSLLSRLLRFISRKRGYENSSLLLVDHCRWLLCEWIKISCGIHTNEYNNGNNDNEGNSENGDENESDRNNNNNGENLKLEDFPYQILDPYCSSFKQFLTNFGDIIFPLICMIENSKKRWALLLGEKLLIGFNVLLCVVFEYIVIVFFSLHFDSLFSIIIFSAALFFFFYDHTYLTAYFFILLSSPSSPLLFSPSSPLLLIFTLSPL